MPVLARVIEEAGIATVTVTMMPDVTAKHRLSRIVGVEFPFGHPFGLPTNQRTQRVVAEAAIHLLSEAKEPESRIDVDMEWPIDTAIAYRDWQPPEPSPMVAYNARMRQQTQDHSSAAGGSAT